MNIPYAVDGQLVRGLDYYTRTTFEIQGLTLGAQDALCGGGRYDNLIHELGGQATPSVGFAAGTERLIIAMENEGLFPEQTEGSPMLYIAPMGRESLGAAFQTADLLRRAGVSVEIELLRRSLRAMMREANRRQARFVLVLGEEEIRSGRCSAPCTSRTR